MLGEDKNTYLIVGALVALAIVYGLGVASGKKQFAREQIFTNDDYFAMKACYEAVSADRDEVDMITGHMGYGDTYEELSSAISDIQSIVSGKIEAVPRNPGSSKSGYYDCE